MLLCDRLLRNATIIDNRGNQLADQSIAIKSGIIIWCGPNEQLPENYLMDATYLEECQGRLVTPGLIDCHTHLVYSGDRATEFQQRMQGASYADIARAGGGILSTVKQTCAVSEEALLIQSLPRILALRNEGVTTVEIKSGYGLDLANELKMLRVARQLGEIANMHVKTTFLGAHAIPARYAGNNQAYVDHLCYDMLPAIAESGLADAVDVFCENIGFTLAQTEQIFMSAKTWSLPTKCHAEQLSNIGASELAGKYHALSSDHLEHLDAKGVKALAQAGSIAVLLPSPYTIIERCWGGYGDCNRL
jgi:imidazolonepropionase